MKLLIFLSILSTLLIIQVHGYCDTENLQSKMMNCMSPGNQCRCLWEIEDCLRESGVYNRHLYNMLSKSKAQLGCGASSLTNLGLPLMILVALAAFFNK